MKDINELMKQAQAMQKKIQEQMETTQQKQKSTIYHGESGAGLVKVSIDGCYEVKKVNIDESLFKEQHEVVEDLIAAAMNAALRQIVQDKPANFADLASMDIAKDFKFPF